MKGKRRHILPVCLMILFCLIGWAGAGRIHAQAAGEEEPEEYDFEEIFGDIYVYFEGRPRTLEEESAVWRMYLGGPDTYVEGNYMYEVVSNEEKTAVLLFARGLEGDVELPQEINGYRIIGLGANMEKMQESYDNFFDLLYMSVFFPSEAGKITGITIPEGVEYISLDAFWGCQNLTRVELPDSLTEIWRGAFCGSGLEEITLPAGMTHISLTHMYQLKKITYKGKCPIEEDEFSVRFCNSLESLTFPEGATYFNTDMILYCENLREVILPESVERIIFRHLEGLPLLESITVPNEDCRYGQISYSYSPERYDFSQITLTVPEDSNLRHLPRIYGFRYETMEEPDEILYTVQKGDTLWKLYREYGCPVEEIAERNGILDINLILIGQELWIPAAG